MDTINPLMSFSSDEIANMDKEVINSPSCVVLLYLLSSQVEDILDDESDTSDQGEDDTGARTSPNGQQPPVIDVLNDPVTSSSSEDSLSGDFPKGFKRKRIDDITNTVNEDFYNSTEDESPSVKFRRGEKLDDDMIDMDAEETMDSEGSLDPPDEVDDGEWNMMGAALEREFLSNNQRLFVVQW